jgi:hypothetical protein
MKQKIILERKYKLQEKRKTEKEFHKNIKKKREEKRRRKLGINKEKKGKKLTYESTTLSRGCDRPTSVPRA